MEKHIENLQKAINLVKIADHMLYVTYPVIKDKRLLLKTLDQVYDSAIAVITSILQYDYLYKRISLFKTSSQENFDIFLNKCAKRYNIDQEELSELQELLSIVESHRKSPIEFLRKEKMVIMSDSLKTTIIDPERLKKYLGMVKRMIEKARFGMNIR